MSSPTPVPQPDPFLFDLEQLHTLAEDQMVRNGLKDFKENRVTWVDRTVDSVDGDFLTATVEDADTTEVLSFEVRSGGDGHLDARCPCHDGGGLCRHEVAALFAYSSRAVAPGELLDAVAGAIEERVQRARSEVRVEHLTGEPAFGAWSAWSVGPETHFPRRYRVHIRSLTRRANYCTCPDFATNQLGTCKHIEAVRHTIQKRPDYPELSRNPAPLPYLFLDWEGERAATIRLHRTANMGDELVRLLDGFFDTTGRFLRRLPDDFLHLADLLEGRSDIDVGQDALSHARRLAERALHQAEARAIRERIQASGGQLPGVLARLYPYQMEGVAFLAANGRALLADDMGLGKTLQAIAAATWLRDHARVERVLIICPASLKQQWAREIERFTNRETVVIQGPASARGAQYRRGTGFFIANYELILRDISVINETLRPDLLILDEAQRIKNWRIKLAAAVKLITSRYAFVLSGTPLENRLEDLYSLMQVVDPQVLGPLWRYRVDFHITDDKGKVLGYRNLSELRRRLAPVMLRRDRQLVRDQLPDRIEQRIDVELSEKQRDLHNSALKAAAEIAQIAKRRPLTPSEQNRLLAALQTARMACNAAGLVDKETVGSPKLDELDSLLDDLCVQSGLKAVIFSQWERMTQMVEERGRALKLGCVRLHGGVATSKRGELINRFRDDDAVQLFISTDAGSTGLNLQSAAVLVNMDVPWNPAILDQRIARIHRLGQKRTVQIVNLISAPSYEEQVLALIQGKRHLFDNVVDPDAVEDVVGVSKKLVEVLVNDLNSQGAPSEEIIAIDGIEVDEDGVIVEAEEPVSPVVKEPDAAAIEAQATAIAAREKAVRDAVTAVQAAFGTRIERILGAGGGLMVVLDRVDAEADRIAAGISESVPVALIDPRTLNSLNRLGAASPFAEAKIWFEPPPRTEPVLLRQAREKLKAARILIEQSCPGPAMEILLGALLAGAAQQAGADTAPTPQQAGIWLYTEVLPKGLLKPEQTALLQRGIAFAHSADALPEALLRELLRDVEGLLGG
ncbi:Helicase [Gammaproteobacteria bacterium]